ncbi:MAG: hypothetical protein SGILL_005011 [Bacillariaceae sp.]
MKTGSDDDKNGFRKTTKKKKLTLDEFFDNLGKQQEQQQSKMNNSRQSQSQTRRKSPRRKFDPVQKTDEPRRKQSDMASFFDEVDALMEKNKRGEGNDSIKRPVPSRQSREEEESLFDILRPAMGDAEPPQPTSDFYDNTSYQQYLDLLQEVMDKPEFLKKHTKRPLSDEEAARTVEWLQATEPSVHVKLPMLDFAIECGKDNDSNGETSTQQSKEQQQEQFRAEIEKQRELFMTQNGWTDKQYTAAMGALVILGNLSAKLCKAAPLEVAWQKLKEAGFRMDQKTLHNYLYVSSTFSLPSARRLSSLTRHSKRSLGGSVLDFLGDIADDSDDAGRDSSDMKEEKKTVDVSAEVALCHNFLYEPSEQSTSIHVRVLVSQGRPNDAEQVLDENTENDDLRLRTYAPVYDAYLDNDDVVSAFKLFVKMKNEKHVELLPETFVQLIACIAENGYFGEGSDTIEGWQESGYPAGSGAALFDALSSELAENSIEITSASAKQLYNAFQRGFQGEDSAFDLQPMNMFESFQANDDPASPGEMIVSRVSIDENSGQCARSRSKLRLIGLDDHQKVQFQDGLLKLCAAGYEERHEQKGSKKVVEALRNFGQWVKDRDGTPFTAILDGPNIAYYMQNFDKGRFNYHQIQFVVDALEEMGENVLVVLPQKYMQDTFQFLTHYTKKHQRLRKAEREIRDRLNAEGKICVVPMGSLDDYYWMYASRNM